MTLGILVHVAPVRELTSHILSLSDFKLFREQLQQNLKLWHLTLATPRAWLSESQQSPKR